MLSSKDELRLKDTGWLVCWMLDGERRGLMETRATCLYVLVPALALERAADKSKIRVVVSKAGWDWEVASPFELHRNGVIIAQASGPAICCWDRVGSRLMVGRIAPAGAC